MIRCYSCKECIKYFFDNRPRCLCIANDKYINELTKEQIEKCEKFKLKNEKEKII